MAEIDYVPNENHIKLNWVKSSGFIFYLSVFCILAAVIGNSYGLYSKRYKGNPEVTIQGSSKFIPEYK